MGKGYFYNIFFLSFTKSKKPFSSILFCVIFIFTFSNFYAQTTIINPNGDGGFETGTTFTTNGWTATTGTATRNQWVCNTGATAGFSGTRCAYISNNTAGTPPPHNYTLNAARVSHIYKDITVPAGQTNISLSFSWIGYGEGSFDYLRVWAIPTSTTPVYGTAITATGTAPTGSIQIGSNLNLQSSWTSTSLSLPSSYAGNSFRLVFEWTNDASSGTQPPAAVDNISLIASPPPSNDNCTGATSITVNPTTTCTTSTSGTTLGATQSQAGCTGTADDDVWYTFTATSPYHTITVTPTTLSNVVFEVFSGTCGSLISLGCTNNTTGSTAETTTLSGLTIGTVYSIRIYSNASGSGLGTFSVCVTTPPPPPSNNLCSNAKNLPCATSNLPGTTVNTLNIVNGTACTMADYGVWYTFVGDGNLNTISVTTTSFDVEMSISSGTCGALTNITCQDSVLSSGTETYTFNTTAGVNYYVYVAYYSSGGTTTGTFTISRTCITPPTNDNCSGAISLTPSSLCSYATYTNAGATASSGVPAPGCSSYLGGDVWFSVVVPSNGTITVDTQTGVMTDGGMALYTGTCGSLTLLACDDDSSANGLMPYISQTGLTPGQTIYIRMWEYGNDNNGTFGICVTSPIPPTNDNCSGATTLTVNPTITCTINTNGTTVGSTQSQAGCSGTADDDVWFQFTATDPSHTITVTPNTLSNAVFQVFSGTCSGLVSLACINATTGTSNETTTLTGLTIGATYTIRVYSNANGSGQGTFSICITTPCTPGNGTGLSSMACPTNIAGGLGLNGADPAPILNCNASTCTSLEAKYIQLGQTTSYTVQSIPYNPPYQYSCLQNSVSINIDDVWSSSINLPFNFCFYGNTYNKCLIGSNGVITFDQTNNTPGGYSTWSFSNNLPSTSLFLNTIFGAYHDIDPSVGGEVGYELVTMPSGCRALVASWSDIPMYSSTCNSLLYTGMIVMYENTNIIEVYMKEKRVCPSWNSGNAVVGLQNATGTIATVAPNRNSLDPDWTTFNEAWRFVPSGTSITSVTWYEGAGTSGPIVGNSSTINVCPAATTTYTAKVTYNFCNGTTLNVIDDTTITISNRKTWNGSVDTDWNKANNWTPVGIPNSSDCVIIPITSNNPIISGTGYNGLAGTLTVLNGATLTVNSNNNITVTDLVTVEASGTFLIQNNASLIQINNVTNSGNITYKRNASIRSLDYAYWSSPVANFNVSNIASPLVLGPIYKWNPTVANPNGGQGNWENASGNTMQAGKGYIVRGPSSFSSTVASTLNGSFTGVPNNGTISYTISRGSDTNTAYHTGTNGTEINNFSDNWNLVGNPYPSAIRGSQFLFNNNTKIEGNIKLWTHGTLPSQIASPFYNTFAYNYSPGDYLTYNFTGTSCCPAANADLFIGAAQGFFVQMKDGPAASDVVTFNNNLRSYTYDNSSFYRFSNLNATNTTFNVNTIERNRIWLDLININNQSDRTLFGYIEGATMGRDSFFDSNTLNTGSMSIYSLTSNTDKYLIQGRQLPFDVNDEVPIGIHIQTAGSYSIAIAGVDGLFNTQNIYLRDKLLDLTYDIKAAPYRFYTTAGTINERFKIVYLNNTLGASNHSFDNSVRIYTKESITINSTIETIDSITAFDLLGRKLGYYANVESNEFTITNLTKNNTALLIQVKLKNGITINQKVIF